MKFQRKSVGKSMNCNTRLRRVVREVEGATLEMSCSQKEPRVRIPNSPPKTQSYQGFCPYDWAFLFSQGHIGVHDFRQELRCASRSALCPAESGYCPLHLPSIFALVAMCLMVMVSRSKSSACVENRSSSVGKVKSDFLIVLSSLS